MTPLKSSALEPYEILYGEALNCALAKALGITVKCVTAVAPYQYKFWKKEKLLGTRLAYTLNEAWLFAFECQSGHPPLLPSWAENTDDALNLCLEIGWEPRAWRLQLAFDEFDWQAEFVFVSLPNYSKDYIAEIGSTPAEALARLALSALLLLQEQKEKEDV